LFCLLLTWPASVVTCTLSLHAALPTWELLKPRPIKADTPAPKIAKAKPTAYWFAKKNKASTANRKDDAAPANAANKIATNMGKPDRKSTRLNSSHVKISYAAFCLKKKK